MCILMLIFNCAYVASNVILHCFLDLFWWSKFWFNKNL